MQQIAVPSLHAPRRLAVQTEPFPLVRHPRRDASKSLRPRKFVAGLLFGVLMSMTLVLLGYAARIYSDQHSAPWSHALDQARSIGR